MNLFITGTDTNVGKTHVSLALLNHFKQQGLSTLGLKPIASGCDEIDGQLYNSDAQQLQDASTIKLDYRHINPIALKQPIAPHLAATEPLSVSLIENKMQHALSHPADIKIIEGAGGWHLPLNEHETMADYVSKQPFAVILVVGMRLGCLNHAILTSQAILQSGAKLYGWIANCVDPEMLKCDENIATLKTWIKAPYLGQVAYGNNPIYNAAHLDLSP